MWQGRFSRTSLEPVAAEVPKAEAPNPEVEAEEPKLETRPTRSTSSGKYVKRPQ
jgi:hypothetical protein